jgi:hypothetical protein
MMTGKMVRAHMACPFCHRGIDSFSRHDLVMLHVDQCPPSNVPNEPRGVMARWRVGSIRVLGRRPDSNQLRRRTALYFLKMALGIIA